MNKDQFIKLFKIRAKLNYLNILKAESMASNLMVKMPPKDMPYIGLFLDDKKGPWGLYQVYLINPSQTVEYTDVESYTGAYSDDLETSKSYKKLGSLKPSTTLLLEESDLGGLDFVIWYHLDLSTGKGKKMQVKFALPKGSTESLKKQTQLDCGVHGLKIPLQFRTEPMATEK